ncbi:hypothetical protein Sjap_009004 [Stephania japonica]|uniref:Ninja-family protein n=1 Tax=Stephania japonica TaxID=461633 RepID=A0AAP0JRH0_9MAGN
MDEDLELNLGLSLGGCFKRYEKSEAAKSEVTNLGDAQLDSEAKKREIQALRRREARRKRDEKKRGRGFVGVVGSEPALKRINCEEKEENQTPISGNSVFPLHCHQFPPVQYMPFSNGFPFPYHVVPCWAAAAAAGAGAGAAPAGSAAEEKNVFHPVACRPLKGVEVQGREGQEQSVSSSSAVSESLNGLSSRETSHSVESKSDQQQVQASGKSNAEGQQSGHSDSSHQTQPTQVLVEENTQTNKIDSSNNNKSNNNNQPAQTKAIEERNRAPSLPIETLRKNNGENNNKPPKPQTKPSQLPLPRTQSLPPMPCVSTTGDGPNGKTINGFLYKYNRTEVSIMCVCHGSSFTPAEFVKHAGGTDVSHPLRHIVVTPSAFG